MSRAPAGFADFFPNAPSVLKHKRKKSSPDSHQADGETDPSRFPSLPDADESASLSPAGRHKNESAGAKRYQHQQLQEDDEGSQQADSGDPLIGVGSASSLSSAASSVFSSHNTCRQTMSYPGTNSSIHALTPLTNTESSPPEKSNSPGPTKSSVEPMSSTHVSALSAPPPAPSQDPATTEAITPATTPPQFRRQARPGPGEDKGFMTVYDPQLDPKLSKEDKHKRKAAYRPIPRDDIAAPPDPRLAIAGYTTGAHNATRAVNKAKLRLAPYTLKLYAPDKNTVGPGPSTRILVTGLDPFTPETQIRTFFGSYGEIAEFDNKIDPATGSFLGICSIRYRDSKPLRGPLVPAAASAKSAVEQGNGQRIQLRQIKVELDREGRRCKRMVDGVVQRARARQQKEEAATAKKASSATPSTPVVVPSSEPPPNAPKGPSGKGTRPPFAAAYPPTAQKPIRPEHALVEKEPIIDSIKRKPYIFIAHCYVPVLGTTIPHLKKRLKMYAWSEVRLDRTGYYIIFDHSKRGQDECYRCYLECNMQALFTYVMNMECNKYGNPNYVRSPSPERVQAEKRQKEIEEEIRREEEMDLEEEKKERADNLDPVRAAREKLETELVEQVMSDIKARIAAHAIYDFLDPARHAQKRKEMGVREPTAAETKAPAMIFSAVDNFVPHKKFGKNKSLRKSLAQNFGHGPRSRKGQEVNAFADERRRKPPPKRPGHAAFRNLHRQMQSFEDEDSDDEQSTFTKDTEEQDSRSISRLSSVAPEDEDDIIPLRPSKRRKLEPLWSDDSDAQARKLFPHLVNKDPGEMADGELDQVVHAFPHTSEIFKRCKKELKYRKIVREADAMFAEDEEESRAGSVLPSTEAATTPDQFEDETVVETPEPEAQLAKKKPVRSKKKATKKQQLEEEVKPSPLKTEIEDIVVDEPDTAEEPKKPGLVLDELPHDPVWGVSVDYPRPTIEEKLDYVFDIDGCQHTIKDAEDLKFLAVALENVRQSSLSDINLFAYKEKLVKKLNTGFEGVSYKEVKIEDYYKPNPTGCARTEGVKKILEAEKSKYLPHRIRVQKAREEREALAKSNPAAAAAMMAKAAAASKPAPVTNSRSTRVNNRRLVNEISTQKQALSSDGDQISIRFNQLKKRKKLVKFDRSAIHNWGLYAQEDISANDMIIEYVGEKVRQKVADIREYKYDKQGVGSSYLFRIDEDTVIDATKKGGIARFINHSCTPNCTAKIIKVDGTKRIVIYALRDIKMNEELTYDYKFERELGSDDRIPCLCGSVNCKGFLN
ncbi:SET domain-containing protein [Phyllosticta citricarpa]